MTEGKKDVSELILFYEDSLDCLFFPKERRLAGFLFYGFCYALEPLLLL